VPQPDLVVDEQRAHRLAMELMALGEGLHSTAQLLARWRVPVALARRCAASAWAETRSHPSATPQQPARAD
jgi:hypothetical protein